ncbi:hypothetical protein CK203_048025 [Vitis vinifera]|uniref:Uncharacterized protein n=1 Tax=Vitis vinifera TaxID=29760 RepID=A0A438GYQ0_VITVI|nr:hypothetical protein CK203_048025 [Vitis vinifera]
MIKIRRNCKKIERSCSEHAIPSSSEPSQAPPFVDQPMPHQEPPTGEAAEPSFPQHHSTSLRSNPRLRRVLWNPWQRCPDRASDTPSEGGGTWAVVGCRNDVARLAHFKSMIRIGYAIVRGVMFTSVVSSWGIRMELLQIAMRAPSHQGEGPYSLHTQTVPLAMRGITHSTRGGILSSRLSTFSGYFTSGIPSANVSPSPNISHPDGRGGRFNFPGQTCPDPLIALTWRVFLSVYNATEFLLKLPDISDRHLEIFCFRYWMSKSPNSPCNPPIIGFLSL